MRPQEMVRSEVEGGLSGPANSLTSESIDCGCGQLRFPKLVKYATRRLFLVFLCSIGFLQAAVQTYFNVASDTISRKFLIDPYVMGWIIYLSDIIPVFFGLIISFWGDRIHRAAWLGGLSLVQCAGLLICIFLNFEPTIYTDTTNDVTHMSIYADDSPELCKPSILSRMTDKKYVWFYSTLFTLIIMQIASGTAHIAYCALGVSYLDDNTKKVNVPVYLGIVVAVKVLGSLLGYLLGWTYLRIDADNFSLITSYYNQYGAWWLGWPTFAILLAIPSFFMAIFPRKLPSEMVEQVAANILDQSGTLRGSQRIVVKKVGSTFFIPSILRLVTDKILTFNILAVSFLLTAIVNFSDKENIFLESRFYAPRPTGIFLGFQDPLISRSITTMTKPLIITLVIIMSGLIIARSKPKARTLVLFSFIVLVVSSAIILGLSYNDCKKTSFNQYSHGGSFSLLVHCNKNCHCSQDADFRPVCDIKNMKTLYSPCHAGCTSLDQNDNRIYLNCSCVDSLEQDARDGPCESDNCQIGWLIHQFFTILVYGAVASTLIGDLLISLRSVNVQDKALTIGYGMTIICFLAYVPGKIGYDELVKSTCQHWGLNHSVCHLHNEKLANYLCYLTAGLILISALLKIGSWLYCADINIYDSELEEVEQQSREMSNLSKIQTEPLLKTQAAPQSNEENNNQVEETRHLSTVADVAIENPLNKANGPVASSNEEEPSGRLKYGPLGPGDRRIRSSTFKNVQPSTDDDLESSDVSPVLSNNSYKPLGLDSDVESDLSGLASRSRKIISNSSLDELNKPPQRLKPIEKQFLNHDNYKDPRQNKSLQTEEDGSSKTDSFEYTKICKNESLSASKGDFNEIGLPTVESYEKTIKDSMNSLRSPTIMLAVHKLDKNRSREILEDSISNLTYASTRNNFDKEMDENRKFRLEKLMQPLDYSPDSAGPPSSSGFGSLQDFRERITSDSRDSLSNKSSDLEASNKKSPLCTNL